MTLLQVTDLVKRFGASVVAVKGISFEILPGRCVALIGPNGAGKTTTLKMLSGLIRPTSGTIRFTGIKSADIRRYIGYLPQYPSFYGWMTGREFLQYSGKLAGMRGEALKKRSAEMMNAVGLQEVGHRRISGYSGGMRQRLGIAQAMIHKPKLLILDEPVSALDPVGRREVLEMMRKLKEETTLLFSTHVLHDAEEICDDVLLIHSGEIALSGELQAIRQEHQQPEIILKADEPLAPWIQGWENYDFIMQLSCDGDSAHIVVNDLRSAKSKLFREIAERNIPIRKFEAAQTTLEDLFMKVVKA